MEQDDDQDVGAGYSWDSSWNRAGELARAWFTIDATSAEARILSTSARRLIQAIIFEKRLFLLSSYAALSQCREFLERESLEPGSVVSRLLSSDDHQVVVVATETAARGTGWAATLEPERNMIVMTALLNLPAADT